jgi:hypothetical protein
LASFTTRTAGSVARPLDALTFGESTGPNRRIGPLLTAGMRALAGIVKGWQFCV